jgi:hypothetical protein
MIPATGAARSFVRKTGVGAPWTRRGAVMSSGDVRLGRYWCWGGERSRCGREPRRAARFRAAVPRRGSGLRGVGGHRAATRCARAQGARAVA